MQFSVQSILRAGFMVALIVVIAGNAEAAAKKPKKEGDGSNSPVFAIPSEITLSADQQTKLDEIKKAEGPKMFAANKKLDDVLTAEQRSAKKDAVAKTKADGTKGKERQSVIDDAVKLTDDQKKQTKEIEADLDKLRLSIKEQIHGILTDEQKTNYKLPKAKKK